MDDNEPVKEIVCDMRAYDSGKIADIWMHRFADRIESAHRREVAELIECLREAIELHCDNLDGDCLHCIRCGVCNYLKWRKALEGANNDK